MALAMAKCCVLLAHLQATGVVIPIIPPERDELIIMAGPLRP